MIRIVMRDLTNSVVAVLISRKAKIDIGAVK
jgi:hypothetical protein